VDVRGQRIGEGAHVRSRLHLLTHDQPQFAFDLSYGRHATDQIGLAITGHAGQHRNPQPFLQSEDEIGEAVAACADPRVRGHTRQQSRPCKACHIPLGTDHGMSIERLQGCGNAVLVRVGSAAVDAPGGTRQPPRNDACAFRPRACTQRDIGFPAREVETAVGRDQLDQDAGMLLAELTQKGRDENVGQHLAGGHAHRARKRALLCRQRAFQNPHLFRDAFGRRSDAPAEGRQTVAALPALKEVGAGGGFEIGKAPRYGGLVDVESLRSAQRRAGARHGQDEAEVVPFDHPAILRKRRTNWQ
jgi:hypothetical protein